MTTGTHAAGEIFHDLENKCTFKMTRKKDDDVPVLLLNCIINVIGKNKNGEYLCTIDKEGGQSYKIITTKVFNSRTTWLNFLGTSSWFGNQNDLETLKAMLFEKKDIKTFERIYPGHSGDNFVYTNTLLVKKNNEEGYIEHKFEDQLVFERDNKFYYIDTTQENDYMPFDLYNPEKDLSSFSFDEFMELWLSQFKNKVLLKSLLGWNLAVFFMDKVKKLRGENRFPFYFLCGLTKAGKTSLFENSLSLFGVKLKGIENYTETSVFTECKSLSEISQIPLIRDEYRRGGKYVVQKEGIFRSLYSGSKITRGTADQQVNTYNPKTIWLLGGEDIPKDPAIARRCVIFRVDKGDKVEENEFKSVIVKANKVFPTALLYAFSKGFDEKIFKEIYDENLISENDQSEEKVCYATLGAVFGKEIGMQALHEAGIFWKERLQDSNNRNREGDSAYMFMEDLLSYAIEQGWFDYKFGQEPKVFEYMKLKGSKLYLKHTPLIKLICGKNKSREDAGLSPITIKSCIMDRYNAEIKSARIDQSGMPTSNAMIIDLDKITEDDPILDLQLEMNAAIEKWEEEKRRKDSYKGDDVSKAYFNNF